MLLKSDFHSSVSRTEPTIPVPRAKSKAVTVLRTRRLGNIPGYIYTIFNLPRPRIDYMLTSCGHLGGTPPVEIKSASNAQKKNREHKSERPIGSAWPPKTSYCPIST
uniref:(northern house mosquito) hypothetical protein n=1 Tax=Culex pipiens TaxID=7175 RepID=A0A8D8AXX9_CULPI